MAGGSEGSPPWGGPMVTGARLLYRDRWRARQGGGSFSAIPLTTQSGFPDLSEWLPARSPATSKRTARWSSKCCGSETLRLIVIASREPLVRRLGPHHRQPPANRHPAVARVSRGGWFPFLPDALRGRRDPPHPTHSRPPLPIADAMAYPHGRGGRRSGRMVMIEAVSSAGVRIVVMQHGLEKFARKAARRPAGSR